MGKDKKIVYISSCLCALLLSSALAFATKNGAIVCAAILAVCALVLPFLIKKQKIYSHNKRQVTVLLGACGFLTLLLYFLAGFLFGFIRNGAVTWKYAGLTLLPTAVAILLSEFVRARILAQQIRGISIPAYLIGVVSEVLCITSLRGISSFNQFMDAIALAVLPALVSNLLYNYLSLRYGMYPNVVYRLVTACLLPLIPLSPAIPDGYHAVAKLFFPVLIYLFIDAAYEKKEKKVLAKKGVVAHAVSGVCILFAIGFLMLMSGRFHFAALVIGSGSMSDELNKGDIIVYEESDGEPAKEGDILVFNRGNSIIVHRVQKAQNINGEMRYITKGDANEAIDPGYVTDSQVIGVVKCKVSLLGTPTVFLRELFAK